MPDPTPTSSPLRVAICWTGVSGYLAACWRALARRPEIKLRVFCFPNLGTREAPFASDITAGVALEPLSADDAGNAARVAAAVAAHRPDIVVIAGWAVPAYNALLANPALAGASFAMAMDTPWRGDSRQRLARFKLARLLRQIRAVIVPGERAWQYARRLGLSESQIHRGMYGYDDAPLAPLHARRSGRHQGWPRSFLYVGRYVEAKGIDVLLAAHARYRSALADADAWPLTCCGSGPLKDQFARHDAVTDRGFVQPADQPAVFEEHGAFVIASRYEPWGVAIAEAMASGLPAICTEACGASVELVRPYHNGLTVATADVDALAAAMRWIHDRSDRLVLMGERARASAIAFSAEVWAERWLQMCRQIAQTPAHRSEPLPP